jgi:2'-5' RNA ligase
LGVDHGPWLDELAADIRQRFRVDERRFKAHITVARARNEAGRRELKRAAAELSEAASEAWLPREITLVQSTTGPHPRYEVIGRRAFEGP